MDKALEASLKALDLMKKSETTVAQFYMLCSETYTEHHTFWAGLAREELAHAEVIRKMEELVRIQPKEFTVGKLASLEVIASFISRMQSNIEKLKQSELPENKALLMAYHIENTFIELKYAEVVSTEDEDYRGLLSKVISDTLKHKEKVVARIKSLSKRSLVITKPS